ncbi:MAG: pyridoxal phosphate-dependent aminotransferase [Myxococcota bacterium]
MPRRPHVSPTTRTLSEEVFGKLASPARAPGGPAHPLHVGDTWREPPEPGRAENQHGAEHPHLHNYAPVQGEPALLDAIVHALRHRTGSAPDRERVQVVPGATAGLSIVCNALLDPGDELLLPAPFWPLIRGIVAARGAHPVQVPFFDRVGAPDFDPERALEQAVTERTAALYLNTPHNPTGRVLPPEVVDAMLRVARRHDLWVLCDEAYEALWFGDGPPDPAWAHPEARGRAVACHTLSKSHGLAGARIGWIHGPEPAMRAIRDLQTFQTYCAARPMQVGAARALREGDGWVLEARRLYAQAGRAAAEALGVEPPQGGTFLFFDASPHLHPADVDCLPFLARCLEAGVRLTPGASCGEAYGRWARLCFTAVPPDALSDALARLRQVLGPPA